MADAYRQMQKTMCHDGIPSGGKRPYGCPCCSHMSPKVKKKFSRKLARAKLKRLPDEFIGTRR